MVTSSAEEAWRLNSEIAYSLRFTVDDGCLEWRNEFLQIRLFDLLFLSCLVLLQLTLSGKMGVPICKVEVLEVILADVDLVARRVFSEHFSEVSEEVSLECWVLSMFSLQHCTEEASDLLRFRREVNRFALYPAISVLLLLGAARAHPCI